MIVIRAFGGRVDWDASGWSWEHVRALEAILDVDIDLTAFSGPSSAADCAPTANVEDRRRKFIQPQRVVDCVNAGRILSEEKYEWGKCLAASS